MNLKQMEYFVAAAEQLNFTRAAKKCFISQTAMTLQIQSLEEKIGVPLFVRDKHHVELTAAGKVYLNEARAILVRAEEAANRAAAVETADKLRNCTVKITAKGGANGKLFGAITGKEISEALMAQFGLDVGKQKIVLDEPIKAFGTYEVKAKLGYEVSARFSVSVSEE